MTNPSPTNASPTLATHPSERMRCGTLVYTKAGLFTLFGWLLWGDFCFTLMETIWPTIMPLVLKSEGAPNLLIAFTITTIPNLMNFVMNPIISTASDRYRSKRGRRIPFLRWATPFVTLFLILLGFSQNIGRSLHGALVPWFSDLSPTVVILSTITVLIICFRFFELFIGTVFWYLFNDVVPQAFMGRFLGLFRAIGSLAGALFNFFLFQYAESHTSILFFGVATLYGTAFTLLTWKIKEGNYPPPAPVVKTSIFSWIRIFVKQCLSHAIYRRLFVYTAIFSFSGAIGAFSIFMAQSIGLSLLQIGQVAGVSAFVSTLLMYPMGVLVDRFHPLRVILVAKILVCLAMSAQFVFLFYEFAPATAFWVYAAVVAVAIPMGAADTAASLPMLMQIFPKDKFGQFCSANAMFSCVGIIVGGLLAGGFLDILKNFFGPESMYYYRFVPVWQFVFMFFGIIALLRVIQEWKSLGGQTSYTPPDPT